MDKRTKKLNDKIAGLRQAYDQVEKTAELLLVELVEQFGSETQYIDVLRGISNNQHAPMSTRMTSCLATFGTLRLMLNEAEREHANLLLGIDPNEPSVP